MTSIAFILFFVATVITGQGSPVKYDEIVAAAQAGQWDHVQALINSDFEKEAAWKPVSFNSVRNLKPTQGGHVYGEAEYSYHSASNVDGKTSEDAGGHKVVNKDGTVKEFDFKPYVAKLTVEPLPGPFNSMLAPVKPFNPLTFSSVRNLKPSQGGHVYGEAEYSYHSASNVNGKTSQDAGGHKVINKDGKVKEFDFTPSTDDSFSLKHYPLALSILDKDIANLKTVLNKN